MMEDCTELFLHYREICRLVWNIGFCGGPRLRKVDADDEIAFSIVQAILFESLVLSPLGFYRQVEEYPQGLGKPVRFIVKVTHPGGTILEIDENLPSEHKGVFVEKGRLLPSQPHQLRFMEFSDWRVTAHREFDLMGVLVERLDHLPEAVGHNAYVETIKCSVWLDEAPPSDPSSADA